MAGYASGSEEEALDIIQESMLSFVRNYSGRPESEWGILFHRVLQSRITDWYRRKSVRQRFFGWLKPAYPEDEGDPFAAAPDVKSPSPVESLHRQELARAIEAAVAKLPLRQQQAFLLRAWEGLDIAQTAYVMSCSEGSVKTHYSRALASLRRLLEEFRP